MGDPAGDNTKHLVPSFLSAKLQITPQVFVRITGALVLRELLLSSEGCGFRSQD